MLILSSQTPQVYNTANQFFTITIQMWLWPHMKTVQIQVHLGDL